MLADSRHVLYHLETTPAQVESPRARKPKNQDFKLDLPVTKPIAVSYAYVRSDLRKTALITGAIIIAQIFLFITLNGI